MCGDAASAAGRMTDPEPVSADVEVLPAATLMLLENRPELHVLLLRRRKRSAFVGGMHVFPGGAVDAADHDRGFEELSPALSDEAASRRLGISRGGLAYWVAAIRETFEEAGVLLARGADTGKSIDFSDTEETRRLGEQRAAVDRGEVRLIDSIRDERLALSLDSMRYVARWITPPGMVRRYDTRFFVARMPTGQCAEHDGRETVHAEWMNPSDALARYAAGELMMLPPTVGMLRILTGFGGSEEVMAAAEVGEKGPDREVRLSRDGEDWRVLLPGDPGYAAASNAHLAAWVRLQTPGGSVPEVPTAE